MGGGRQHLAAFAALHRLEDADERRRVARQGLAMLAQLAEREPAPLEGFSEDDLVLAVRTALSDGRLAARPPARGTAARARRARDSAPARGRRSRRRPRARTPGGARRARALAR